MLWPFVSRIRLIEANDRYTELLNIINGYLNGAYINHERIGLAFCNWSSDNQAKFLNTVGFAFDGWNCVKYENHLHWVVNKLNAQAEAFILDLSRIIESKREEQSNDR